MIGLQGHLACFLLAAGVLSLEIELTRFFSILIWYHFAFLIVSVAILGLSVAGLVLVFGERWKTSEGLERRAALAFAWLSLGLVTVGCRVPIPALAFAAAAPGGVLGFSGVLLAISLTLAIPFVAAGVFFARYFT